jgi:hypothetical protein
MIMYFTSISFRRRSYCVSRDQAPPNRERDPTLSMIFDIATPLDVI